MRKLLKTRNIRISIFIIALVSFLQPYLVLRGEYGPSSSCWDCMLIEQTFFPSLLFLAVPLSLGFLILTKRGYSKLMIALVISSSFALLSYATISLPLFDDRVAAWSTYTFKEIFISSFYLALPSLSILSGSMFLSLLLLNMEKRIDFLDR